MPLIDLKLAPRHRPVPRAVRGFLRTAERRIARFQQRQRVSGFMPSDFACVYGALRALVEGGQARGNLFCEWGSGFGVVTCLAALLDFEACGIEIEPELVDAARCLADDFELPVEFTCGSFIPRGAEAVLGEDPFSWLDTHWGNAQGELDPEPDDFDVIFAYPWPDEEQATERLFEQYAAPGAILLTYHGGECRLQRKRAG